MKKVMYDIDILSPTTVLDGIGGSKIEYIKDYKIKGIIDMLGQSDRMISNQFVQESTHILLTFDKRLLDKGNKKIVSLGGVNYTIQYVDNPLHFVGSHWHIEVYLKKVGDMSGE